jgi:hypothetical protein
MSYILSALKKAESERREQAGGVGVSAMVEPRFADKSAASPALMLVATIIALVVLVIWLWLAGSPGSAVGVVSKPAATVVEVPAATRSSDFDDSVELGSVKPLMAPERKAISAQQSVFDNIDIKGHLYVATRPSLRKIVINDSTLREGDKINGILVEEITETSVILSFEGVEKTISAY